MEGKNHSSGYSHGPPWLFKGSALYQLHLVKAETARVFIPKELKLVEAFGYTLGGLFFAHYDDSPAATFDELVVIAGLVWNPPTSCAWAARVIVNSQEACRHGRKEVGLPSHVGVFSKQAVEKKEKTRNGFSRFLDMIGISSNCCGPEECTEILVSERNNSSVLSLCRITLPHGVRNSGTEKKWMGPKIKLSLPSFSGKTVHNPHLLKYSCQIECRVRAVEPAKILAEKDEEEDDDRAGDKNQNIIAERKARQNITTEEKAWNQSLAVLLSKPILTLNFSLLKMQVAAPTVVVPHTKKKKQEVGYSTS